MGRTPCCDKEHTNKGAWTNAEDLCLTRYINANGEGNWRALPKAAGLNRCGKSCRLRWVNYLKPGVKRGNFTDEEDELIIQLHSTLGNKWSKIATSLPQRTDNEIKNHWNTHIRRKLCLRGINPVTHEPIPATSAATTIATSAATTIAASAATTIATSAPPPANTAAPAVGPAASNKKVISANNNDSGSGSSSNSIVTSGGSYPNNNNKKKKNTGFEYHVFNVFVNSKVKVDGNGESASSSGVSAEEKAYNPEMNLELSLAPPNVPSSSSMNRQ